MYRNEYELGLRFNGRDISRVIVDQHYKLAHPEISDEIILELVKLLDGGNSCVESSDFEFEYFKKEPLFYLESPYRLVFLLSKFDSYIGVVNAFRVRRKTT